MVPQLTHTLSEVLDPLESSVQGENNAIKSVVAMLGHRSFASVALVLPLIATSPASNSFKGYSHSCRNRLYPRFR